MMNFGKAVMSLRTPRLQSSGAVSGDCHGDFSRFRSHHFPEAAELSKKDYVIVLGDMGILWDQEESESELEDLRFFERLPFTTLFIDGNHENFDRLNALPVTTWHGRKVHRISGSLIHLMRGQVFDLEGKTFACTSDQAVLSAGLLPRIF